MLKICRKSTDTDINECKWKTDCKFVGIKERIKMTHTSDWLVASSTKRSSFGMVMSFAIWQTFVIEERSSIERLSAILKYEISSNNFFFSKSDNLVLKISRIKMKRH